jgi:hypothetical protein
VIASFDVAALVARVLNRGDDETMRAALELRGSPSRGPESRWADRVRLLKRVILAPIRSRFGRAARPFSGHTAVYDVGLDETYQAHRRDFAQLHFGDDVDFIGADFPHSAGGEPGPWLRWYFFGVGTGLLAFFDFSSRRYFWLGALLLDVQAVARIAPALTRVYCFRMFDRRPYLIATFLAKHTSAQVVPVFQNIPLYRNCRYFHLRLPVVVTSKVNIPEVEYYRSKGMFMATEVIYRSQEFVSAQSDVPPRAVAFDIGLFSSGEWARVGGLYQTTDIDVVRSGVLADNVYAQRALWLAGVLCDYAVKNGRTLRIYPHPYERRLHSEYGIEPPYAALADGGAVTIDWGGRDSRSRMFEPFVAVSLQSSFIWERLDLGLEYSFIHEFGDTDLDAFLRDSLGDYKRNVFRDAAELVAELDAAFEGAGSISGPRALL